MNKIKATKAGAWVFLLSCGFIACTGEKETPKEQNGETVAVDSARAPETVELTDVQLQHADIVTGKAEKRASSAGLSVNGLVVAPPENRHTVGFPMGGYLSSVRLVSGATVRKGTVMATLEDMAFIQLQEDYLMAKSRLVAATADYERQKLLNSTQSASDKVYQQARAEYEAQRILVAAQGEKLRLIGIDPTTLNESNITRKVELRSPINGVVSKVLANPGKYAAPEDVLFELVDPSQVYLALSVYEKDARLLKVGQQVRCYANTDAETPYTATVKLINGSVNENRAVEVWCAFNSSSTRLMPGTFMTANIRIDGQEGELLPESAVVRWENQHYIFSVEGPRRFSMRQVELGATGDGYVQVLSGLPEKEIVLKNAYSLLMMLKNGDEG